jgi:transcription initiation factor TFIID subunit 15
MGDIPSTANMISAIITSPGPGEDLAANTDFTISVQVQGLVAGTFTNPDLTYYAAPQQLQGGQIVGHTHVTVQDLNGDIATTTPPNPDDFVFFKGINDAGNGNGLLSAAVAGGLAAGTYRVCSMTSSSNHQPVLMPVAQRGAQDDCQKFTVGQGNGGNGNAGGNNGAGNGANGGAAGGNNGADNGAGNGANGADAGGANGGAAGGNNGADTGAGGANDGANGADTGAGNGANGGATGGDTGTNTGAGGGASTGGDTSTGGGASTGGDTSTGGSASNGTDTSTGGGSSSNNNNGGSSGKGGGRGGRFNRWGRPRYMARDLKA